MSDTPLSDAQRLCDDLMLVPVDFARKLERRVAALEAERDGALRALAIAQQISKSRRERNLPPMLPHSFSTCDPDPDENR